MLIEFWREIVKPIFIFIIAICAFFAFIAGCGEAVDHGKCKYPRLVSWIPTRIIGCELFKKRWD